MTIKEFKQLRQQFNFCKSIPYTDILNKKWLMWNSINQYAVYITFTREHQVVIDAAIHTEKATWQYLPTLKLIAITHPNNLTQAFKISTTVQKDIVLLECVEEIEASMLLVELPEEVKLENVLLQDYIQQNETLSIQVQQDMRQVFNEHRFTACGCSSFIVIMTTLLVCFTDNSLALSNAIPGIILASILYFPYATTDIKKRIKYVRNGFKLPSGKWLKIPSEQTHISLLRQSLYLMGLLCIIVFWFLCSNIDN